VKAAVASTKINFVKFESISDIVNQMKTFAFGGVLLATMTGSLSAQPQPSFDVASIKPITGRVVTELRINPGRLEARGATLAYLIEQAYGLPPLRISGGPAWLTSDRFNVDATAEGSHSRDELLKRLQTLLADRFKLRFHRETKELPAGVLTVGKNGTKLQPIGKREGSDPSISQKVIREGVRRIELTGHQVSLPFLANHLSRRLNLIVVDRTGLSGEFDFNVEVTPDPVEAGDPNVPEREVVARIFMDFIQKIGLKLESQKAPVEVVVVDQAEKPGEN